MHSCSSSLVCILVLMHVSAIAFAYCITMAENNVWCTMYNVFIAKHIRIHRNHVQFLSLDLKDKLFDSLYCCVDWNFCSICFKNLIQKNMLSALGIKENNLYIFAIQQRNIYIRCIYLITKTRSSSLRIHVESFTCFIL